MAGQKIIHLIKTRNRWLLLTAVSLLAVLIILLFRILQPGHTDKQKNAGTAESCISCHGSPTGFSGFHDPDSIGCVSCHLGHPDRDNKELAHEGLVRIPGNLNDAVKTCGKVGCHPGIALRIENSLMTTASGIVSVDRYVFGESEDLSVLSDIRDIGHSPADKHLRNLCARCHLGKTKYEYGPIGELSRGGGCNACHLNYSDEALVELLNYSEAEDKEQYLIKAHPTLNLKVSNDHCMGCHSRSGRISLSYTGWHETLLDEMDMPGFNRYKLLADKRVLEYINEDVHHRKGLGCIDCHISYEIMGDGNQYVHKEEQLIVQCKDCHFSGRPKTVNAADLDYESKKIFEIRGFEKLTDAVLASNKRGLGLINTYLNESGEAVLVLKNSGKKLSVNSPLPICSSRKSHADLSCESCHTSWTPQCIGCHNAFDPLQKGYDLLEDKEREGSWVEYVGKFLADRPTLGVRYDRHDPESFARTIITVTPGMVLTVDMDGIKGKTDQLLFHRLFAPISAHTISQEGRPCVSCHNDPLALGYGRGRLDYRVVNGAGKWVFEPRFAPKAQDGLPEDAWIGFLKTRTTNVATRNDIRPFTIEEQRRVLTVGACLICHSEDEEFMLSSLDDFQAVLSGISDKCVLPEW